MDLKNLQMKLTRAELENLARPIVEKTIEITKRALENSPFKKKRRDS